MKPFIYIALAFALAIWVGTMCGHWANRYVKQMNPIELEVMP